MQSSSLRRVLLSLAPPVLAIVVFAVAVRGDFVFDDVLLLERDTKLREFDLERIFASNYWGEQRFDVNYRPIVLLSYALNFVAGDGPMGFRAVNVVLNALVAWAAFRLFERIVGNGTHACLGAALFGVLAIHSEAVAWIVGRAELISAFCVLVAWRFALRERASKASLVVIAASILVGLGAKESAVVAIPLAAATAWALRRPMPWSSLAAMVLATGVYLALRQLAIGDEIRLLAEGRGVLVTKIDNPLYSTFCDPATRILNAIALLGDYALLVVFPWTLSADYSSAQIPVLPLTSAVLWLRCGAVVLALGGSAIAFAVLGRRIAALAVLAFPLAFAVTSNVLFPIGTIFAERLAFLPSLALPLLTIAALEKRAVLIPVMVVLIALNAGRSVARCLDWRDRDTLYTRTVEASPDSARAQFLAASVDVRRASAARTETEYAQSILRAEQRLERALSIRGDSIEALGALAEVYAQRVARGVLRSGETPIVLLVEAERCYERAFDAYQRRPQHMPAEWRVRRGLIRLEVADIYAREADAYAATLAGRTDADALRELAKISIAREKAIEKRSQALADFDRFIAERSDHPDSALAEAHGFRALIHARLGSESAAGPERDRRFALARADFDRALRVDRDNPTIWNNSAYLRSLNGDLDGALADYRAGLEACARKGKLYAPDRSEHTVWSFHLRIAELLEQQGRISDAASERAAAREIESEQGAAR